MCSSDLIATTNRGHKELIDNKKNGILIKINCEKELVKEIIEIMNDKDKHTQFIKNGKEKVEIFSLENTKKQMEDIYRTIINNNHK